MAEKSPKGLLVYTPNQYLDVETPRPDGSLGLPYLAAALEQKGYQTDILDASVGGPSHTLEETFYRVVEQDNGLARIGMDFEEIAQYVARGGYDFVGINSNFTILTNMAIQTAAALKRENPARPVFLGGVNARALKERFLQTGYFDGVCLTEGERIFPRMIQAYFKEGSIAGVSGVAYNLNGTIQVNPVDLSCIVNNLDELPMPAWDKLPMDKYQNIDSPHGVMANQQRPGNKYAPIMTSRGCPFHCAYCHISEEKGPNPLTGKIGNLRLHSIERVIEEIDKLKSLGVERLFFEDDSLLAHKKRTKEIFRQVNKFGFTLADVNGVNLRHLYDERRTLADGSWEVDFEYLDILKEAGFDQIVFPAESGSPRIINTYASGKVIPGRMDLPYLMKSMARRKIAAPANIMIGFPDETEEEMAQSIKLAEKLRDAGAPYVTFFIPIPFPGSKLYDLAISGGYLSKDFNPDEMNWKTTIMKNTKVPSERLIEIRNKANEDVNTEEHLRKRKLQSVGKRLKFN